MRRATVCILTAALLGLAACQTEQTYRSDRVQRRPMTTDPFGGASLMTGTDFHNAPRSTPGHNDDYFATPRRSGR